MLERGLYFVAALIIYLASDMACTLTRSLRLSVRLASHIPSPRISEDSGPPGECVAPFGRPNWLQFVIWSAEISFVCNKSIGFVIVGQTKTDAYLHLVC